MSNNFNQIILVGRTGQDPDTKYFNSGSVITKLTLAVDRRTSNKDEDPDWFNLEIWGKLAEVASNYTRKGSLIGIQGELKLDEWTDKQTGILRSKPVVRVTQLQLLGSKPDSQQTTTSQTASVAVGGTAPAASSVPQNDF